MDLWLFNDLGTLGAVLIVVLFLLLACGLWIGLALMLVGFIAIETVAPVAAGQAMATTIWGQSYEWSLTALPMFIWMGEILHRTRVSEDMFEGIAPWVSNIPGRLLHINTFACGIFAAISGSSTATAATIGRMSLPELARRGYDERISLGSLAASGTLGIMIPPSIALIIYGFLTGVSIVKLFIAGLLPGLLVMLLFTIYIMAWAMTHPTRMPASDIRKNFWERVRGSGRLWPVIVLIIAVLGSIYTGTATPTEAAVIGVAGALVLSASYRLLTWRSFVDSLYGAMRLSTMIAFILAGSAVLQNGLTFVQLPANLAAWIGGMDLTTYTLLFALAVLFVVLGCFIDGISIIVLTAAIIIPLVTQAGIDLIWFGIFVVIVGEIGLVTPPVGFNLFVVQGLTGKQIDVIARGALPFFLLLCLAVAVLTAFPQVVTWLPEQIKLR